MFAILSVVHFFVGNFGSGLSSTNWWRLPESRRLMMSQTVHQSF